MRRFLIILPLFFLGCDSGSGDSKIEEGAVVVEPAPNPPVSNTYCEHDGDILFCEAVCVPADNVEAVEESKDAVSVDALGQTTPAKAITIGGAVTIIAECGSDVSFDVTSDDSVATTTGGPNE